MLADRPRPEPLAALRLTHPPTPDAMASDLDTVRTLRALFDDMPRAPQGLSPEATRDWIDRAMADHEGGDLAYSLEHITRSSMLDLILRLREDGYLQEDAAFDKLLRQVSTPQGRQTFMDWCINAQKSADATARLLNRAKPAWTEPAPLYQADPEDIRRFVAGRCSGPGALYAEFAARQDVREVGVLAQAPGAVHEFPWGFVTESDEGWAVYVAEVWRQGTVGSFERFLSAWQLETAVRADGVRAASFVPEGLSADAGITRFSCLILTAQDIAALRTWVGEVFLAHMLPVMAARVLDPNYDFPDAW
jgi:hypothetical protein